MMDFDMEVDASGLNCPLPILRAKKALVTMEPGQILHLIATDPGSVPDFTSFCNQTANEMVGQSVEGESYHFLIRKG